MKHKHTLLGLVLILALTVACAAQSTGDTCIVRSGDSLSKIAARNGTTTDALVRLNEGKYPSLRDDPGLIRVGWVLNVGPGGSQPPPADRRVKSPVPTEEQMRQVEQEIIRLTNEARREQGLHELTVDPVLTEVARERAQEVTSEYSHRGKAVALRRYGLDPNRYGENIGQAVAGAGLPWSRLAPDQFVTDGWLLSEGHRTNILHPGYQRIGVGVVYRSPTFWYGVQLFALD